MDHSIYVYTEVYACRSVSGSSIELDIDAHRFFVNTMALKPRWSEARRASLQLISSYNRIIPCCAELNLT